ncbi:Uncharacterised protein [Vibrio cholerae]|nr:Uncharacterised protein [Vibrio cholerae]CSA14130.1 Uncharacterised protein [Vibrio cholerae]CSB39983.1 Uncharacterised protein [Vibrio cholerae]CSC12622.1 Uncharacterised protein [Vibrio cholerae]
MGFKFQVKTRTQGKRNHKASKGTHRNRHPAQVKLSEQSINHDVHAEHDKTNVAHAACRNVGRLQANGPFLYRGDLAHRPGKTEEDQQTACRTLRGEVDQFGSTFEIAEQKTENAKEDSKCERVCAGQSDRANQRNHWTVVASEVGTRV